LIFAEAVAESHWVWDVLELLSVPALVALNGFFVAAEFSLVSLRGTKIEEMVKRGVSGAKAVDSATSKLDRTIAATQLGITLASIILGWVAEPPLARLIEPLFALVPAGWHGPAVHTVATGLALLVVTFMHVVFGEYIPKSLAIQAPERTALLVAQPLNVFARLTYPLTTVMKGTGNSVLRLFGMRPASGEESVHSIEELRLLIEDTEEAGLLDEDQAEFVQNVFMLSNKTVQQCMVPREKMAALDVNTPPDKVLEAVREEAHTRMPVFDGTLDNIVGVVNTKDLFHLFSLRGIVLLDDALYPATFLPPNEDIASALRLLQRSRKPMALVRDDADKILGLITLEDVLEEIVGEIEDEHDRPTRKAIYRRRPGPRPITGGVNGVSRPAAAQPPADRRATGPTAPSPTQPGTGPRN
jgi:putative hemolysin